MVCCTSAIEAGDVVSDARLVLARAWRVGSLVGGFMARCAYSCLECSDVLGHGGHAAGSSSARRELLTCELALEARERVPHNWVGGA